MTVSGILVSALAMAFSVIVGARRPQQRIAESKDVTFVQTWLPTDLSSATQTWIEPQVPFRQHHAPGHERVDHGA